MTETDSDINKGSGCLTIFGGIFALAGLTVGIFAVISLWGWWDARDWEPVPATVLSANLRVSHGDDSTTYEAEGRYQYEWFANVYENDRISFSSGGDNIGSFHEDTYRMLKQHLDSGEPIEIFVNPDNPNHSVVSRDMRWGLFAFMMIFPLVFGGVGFGIIFAGWWGRGKLKRENASKQQHPGQPWMWKEEWTSGVLRSNTKAKMWVAVVFAAIWNLVSIPILFILPEEIFDKQNYLALLALFFPVAGVGLIVWAVKQYRQWKRFGNAKLDLNHIPVPLGGRLDATLICPGNIPRGAEMELKLSCIRKRRTGSGKRRRTTESILWQDEQRLPVNTNSSGNDLHLPVEFVIPKDQPQCDWSVASNSIVWRLDASSEIPGADFSASFELPVFNRGEKYHVDERSNTHNIFASQDEGNWKHTGVVYKLTAQGERFYFPPARNKNVASIITGLALIFGGVGVGLLIASSLFLGGIFTLIGTLAFWGSLSLWLRKTEVTLRSGEMKFRKGLFGLGKPEQLYRRMFKNIKLDSTMSSGNTRYYDIVAILVDDRKLKLAHNLHSKRDAQALADKFIETLGLDFE